MNSEMEKGIIQVRAWFKDRQMGLIRANAWRIVFKRLAIVTVIACISVLGAWIHLSGMNILEFLRSIDLL